MNAPTANLTHWAERIDMAAAFRWTVKLNLHEAVANHFSPGGQPRRHAVPDQPQRPPFRPHHRLKPGRDRRQ